MNCRRLDLLQDLGVDGLVFLVFMPTPGTRYADRQPPTPEAVADLLAEARLRFPDCPPLSGLHEAQRPLSRRVRSAGCAGRDQRHRQSLHVQHASWLQNWAWSSRKMRECCVL